MHYRLFQYPLPVASELDELNEYLARQRVASVSHQFLSAPGGPLLVFLVQAVGNGVSGPARGENRVDYRALLGEAEFAVSSRLRAERKKIADEEGVPVYTIFSNAQLAEMVRKQAATPADLSSIEGVGAARAEKYGPRILAQLAGPA